MRGRKYFKSYHGALLLGWSDDSLVTSYISLVQSSARKSVQTLFRQVLNAFSTLGVETLWWPSRSIHSASLLIGSHGSVSTAKTEDRAKTIERVFKHSFEANSERGYWKLGMNGSWFTDRCDEKQVAKKANKGGASILRYMRASCMG